jgi:hypothetical protein
VRFTTGSRGKVPGKTCEKRKRNKNNNNNNALLFRIITALHSKRDSFSPIYALTRPVDLAKKYDKQLISSVLSWIFNTTESG